MTEESIFLDSSVFLSFFIEGKPIFQNLVGDFVTSTNVIEEVTYVLIKQKARESEKGIGHYELLSYLRKNKSFVKKIFMEVKKDIKTVLTTLDIKVIEPSSFVEMWNMIERYSLLPNDALIAATCRFYEIKKIATFDKDFLRVDFLDVIKL